MSLRDIKVNIVITRSTLKMFPKCSELSGPILVLKKYAIYMWRKYLQFLLQRVTATPVFKNSPNFCADFYFQTCYISFKLLIADRKKEVFIFCESENTYSRFSMPFLK